MKFNYKILGIRLGRRSSQEQVIDFIGDKKNIQKAAEGSMQKRIDVFEKAALRKHSA